MSDKVCPICNNPAYRYYPLCKGHLEMKEQGIVIKNEKTGKWEVSVFKTNNSEKDIKKDNAYKFYDENKEYILKPEILNEYEMRFFNIVRDALKSKYVIIPQVNLQSIISTNTNKRNDELYRNVDFAIFYAKTFFPFLIIELNGQQHYTNEYYIERDKSVKAILDKVKLPLLTIDIKDLKKMEDNDVYVLMKKVLNQLDPSFFYKLFNKNTDKHDLSWVKEYIKNLELK